MAGIFTQAFGGSLTGGMALADKLQQRVERSKLQELSELARGGLGNAEIANQLGAGLIGLGQVGAGINAQNVPYQREQQALQRNDQLQQREFLNRLAMNRENRADIAFNAPAPPPNPPAGYFWRDENNPSAGVIPIPGIQADTPKATSSVAKINQDYANGLITTEQKEALIANATTPKSGIEVITNPDGTTTTRVGGRGGSKAPTEGQAKSNIFATRAEASGKLLSELDAEGTDLLQVLLGLLPLGNYANTSEFQEYKQAQRDFVNATLRQESGAVIAPEEFANAQQQYFPQPGDKAPVIEQKRRNREIVMKVLREASGPFATKVDSDFISNTSNGKITSVPKEEIEQMLKTLGVQ